MTSRSQCAGLWIWAEGCWTEQLQIYVRTEMSIVANATNSHGKERTDKNGKSNTELSYLPVH